MYFGHLSWKPSFLSPRSGAQVFLCHPLEIMDVKLIHDSVLSKSLVNPHNEPEDLNLYGHVSLSAISGFPILILSNGKKLSVVHFSQVEAIRDEVELGLACSFAIATGSTQYKFSAETSIDYQ
jgi:hypothetical protein